MGTAAEESLLDIGLRKTPCRIAVLGEFLRVAHALSHADLETALPDFDRVTLYRTLATFQDKALIHKVVDDAAVVKYALNKGHTHAHSLHSHVHFKCTQCQNTVCVEEVTAPQITLPPQYVVERQEVLMMGVCPRCAAQ